MKKFVAAIATALLAFGGLVAGTSPASASTAPNLDIGMLDFHWGVTLVVGDVVNWNWNQVGPNITGMSVGSGSLPPSLTMNNDGTVTGTITESDIGTWHFNTLNYTTTNGSAVDPNVDSTITVVYPTSATPYISLKNLRDSSCDLSVSGSIPATAITGSISVVLSNGTNTASISLRDYSVGELIDLNVSLNNLNALYSNANVTGVTLSESPSLLVCGDSVTATLAYTATNANAAGSVTSSSVVATAGTDPGLTASVQNVGDGKCSALVSLYVPSSLNVSALSFSVGSFVPGSPAAYSMYSVSGYPVDAAFSIVVPMADPSTLSSDYTVTAQTSQGSWQCGDSLSVVVNYSANGSNTQVGPTTGIASFIRCTSGYLPSGEHCIPVTIPVADTKLADNFSYNYDPVVTMYVGMPVNWDWQTCTGADSYWYFFSSGSFPPGISWDAGGMYDFGYPTGALTGTPTQTGTYTLSGLNCWFFDGPRSAGIGGGSWGAGSVTINVVNPPSPTPTVAAHALVDLSCDVNVVGTIPTDAQAGSVSVELSNGTNTATYTLSNHTAGSLVNLTLPLANLASAETLPNVVSSAYSDSASSFGCNQNVTATLNYTAVGQFAAASASSASVTARDGSSTSIQTGVVPVANGSCTALVSLYIPSSINAQNVWVNVGDFASLSGPTGYSVPIADYPTDQNFSIAVPMTNIQSIQSGYLSGTPALIGNYSCGSHIQVSVSYQANGMYSETDNSAPILSSDICRAGSYFHSGTCTIASIGYYVSATGATSQTACPSGSTTLQTGSTAFSQCFKQVAQSVVGLKTIKAMKFKAKVVFPKATSAGGQATYTATGKCTVASVSAGTRVNGVVVSVPSVVVTASSKAGNCTVTATAAAASIFSALTKTFVIKVNKTGK